MRIVGRDDGPFETNHVHTIDVWYSTRRRMWTVERLSADGHHIGHAAHFPTEPEARACLEAWLRDHSEAAFVAAEERSRSRARGARQVRRAA